VDLGSLIIAVFCIVEDTLRRVVEGRLHQRGPRPLLADSEVLTIEVVGEYLGLDRDTAVFAYFRRHYRHFFPALGRVHRTTFARQAANLWRVKEALWQPVAPVFEAAAQGAGAYGDGHPQPLARE
jgi:hypothetical protein